MSGNDTQITARRLLLLLPPYRIMAEITRFGRSVALPMPYSHLRYRQIMAKTCPLRAPASADNRKTPNSRTAALTAVREKHFGSRNDQMHSAEPKGPTSAGADTARRFENALHAAEGRLSECLMDCRRPRLMFQLLDLVFQQQFLAFQFHNTQIASARAGVFGFNFFLKGTMTPYELV
jgi:hypothetical protein